MRLQLADGSVLKDSITVISDLVNEGRFKITKNGIEMIAMDPASVAMVIYKLLASSFTEYHVDKEEEVGINLTSLKQILRRARPDDVVTLEIVENKLNIQLRSGTIRTFSLPLIHLEEKEQRIPNLTFPVTVTLPSSTLADAIEDVGIVAESVSFAAEPEKFMITAEGDLSKADIEIKSNDEVNIRADTKAKVKSKYSVEYLKKMIAGSKLAEVVNVQFSQDYPLKLEYKIMDRVLLQFILAPRVEND